MPSEVINSHCHYVVSNFTKYSKLVLHKKLTKQMANKSLSPTQIDKANGQQFGEMDMGLCCSRREIIATKGRSQEAIIVGSQALGRRGEASLLPRAETQLSSRGQFILASVSASTWGESFLRRGMKKSEKREFTQHQIISRNYFIRWIMIHERFTRIFISGERTFIPANLQSN